MYFEHLRENFENYQDQKTFPLLELLDCWSHQTSTTQKDFSDKVKNKTFIIMLILN